MAKRRAAPDPPSHATPLAVSTEADYALPGTLARRFMRCGKPNCLSCTGPTGTGPAPSPGKPTAAASPRSKPSATSPGSITPDASANSSPISRNAHYAPSATPKTQPRNCRDTTREKCGTSVLGSAHGQLRTARVKRGDAHREAIAGVLPAGKSR